MLYVHRGLLRQITPAVTEAHYAVPLIVITADRPHELREVGAPQAIDQVRMYGNHVKIALIYQSQKITTTLTILSNVIYAARYL